MPYDHVEIEARWQRYMFPYPSGVGLHVGHPEGYTASRPGRSASVYTSTRLERCLRDIRALPWRRRLANGLEPRLQAPQLIR